MSLLLLLQQLALILALLIVGDSLAKNENATPTLIISLDGLRADKLEEFVDSNENSFLKKYMIQQGTKADYLTPAFATNTFPNHFAIVTGNCSF
jgi:predicted AlkP superfamily pyrophosphatase or phosphodiesterase